MVIPELHAIQVALLGQQKGVDVVTKFQWIFCSSVIPWYIIYKDTGLFDLICRQINLTIDIKLLMNSNLNNEN